MRCHIKRRHGVLNSVTSFVCKSSFFKVQTLSVMGRYFWDGQVATKPGWRGTGNVFTGICLFTRGCIPACTWVGSVYCSMQLGGGLHPSIPHTSLNHTPLYHTHFIFHIPLYTTPHPLYTSTWWPLKRAVRILLECILVWHFFRITHENKILAQTIPVPWLWQKNIFLLLWQLVNHWHNQRLCGHPWRFQCEGIYLLLIFYC